MGCYVLYFYENEGLALKVIVKRVLSKKALCEIRTN